MPTRDRREAGAGDVVARHAIDRACVDGGAGPGALVGGAPSRMRCSGTNTSLTSKLLLPVPARPTTCQSSMTAMSLLGTRKKQRCGGLPSATTWPPQSTQWA